MQAPHIVLGLLVAAGIAASVAVIPRDRELALMYLKGLDYEAAQSELEQRLKSGDLSVGVVMPLTRVYLEKGEYESAVALMETFAEANPNETAVRTELAQLYKQSARIYDYLATLSDIARVRPTEKILHELSDYYSDHGETEKQIEVLRTLIRQFSARYEDWMDLAQLESDIGNFEQAASALIELDRRFKVPRTQRTVEFYVSVLARTGREADAYAMARNWVDENRNGPAVLGIVRQLVGATKETEALAILDRVPADLSETAALFSERIRLELRVGRRDAAFQRLRAALVADRLPPEFEDDLIDLALERNLIPLSISIAMKGSPARLPDWQVASLVGMAPPDQSAAVAKWVLASPELLERRPVLAASVLRTIGNNAGALAAAEKALANAAELSSDQVLGLVLIVSELGRPEPARRHLMAFLDRFGWDEASALDLAGTMIRLGQAEEGWRRIQVFRDRQRQRAPGIDAAWALLSAAAGRADQVVAWLDSPQAAQLDANLLGQLSDLAEVHGQPKLAVAAARRLVTLRNDETTRLQLAGALAALGVHDEVLTLTRPLSANSPEAERLYVIALASIAKRGDAKAVAELDAFWNGRLADPRIEADTLSLLVYSMMERGLGAEAMPAIYWLAEKAPESWLSAAAEEAKKAKRQAEARAFFARQLTRTDLSPQAREQALFALNEVGGGVEALPELARLAQSDPTDQWFYAYVEAAKKANRKAELQAFLANEVKRGDLPRQRREARLYAYLEVVGPDVALPELRRFAEAYGGDWNNAYDEALVKLGRTDELRRLLVARASRRDAAAAERREIVYRLIDLGDRDAAIGILRVLAEAASPTDPVVGELTYLWREAKQGRAAAEWLAARAASSTAADRPAWARLLLDAEEPARALAALGPMSPTESDDASSVRFDALMALRRPEDAGRVIAARAEAESDVGRLRALAKRGLEADARQALAVVYGKIVRQVPGDPEASRWLGIQDFGTGRTGLARRHLIHVIETPLADYEVNNAYGEILLQAGERDPARLYFRRALQQLDASGEKTVPARLARAQLLNRLGESGQALALMAALVEERPADPGLRADYANLLMDNKLYDQARRVLTQR